MPGLDYRLETQRFVKLRFKAQGSWRARTLRRRPRQGPAIMFQEGNVAAGPRIRKARKMRVRENRATLNASLTMAVTLQDRAQLIRYVIERLRLKGVPVDETMIHVDHLGYNNRIDWDEYLITVDRYGVFGFIDQPCPDGPRDIEAPLHWPAEQSFAADIEPAFDVPCAPRAG